MQCLVYVSAATREMMGFEQIADLLAACRRNNHALNVTGVLVFSGGNFFQALEGEAETVEHLFTRICRDPRHGRITKLLSFDVAERQFPNWSMELRDIDDLPPDQRQRCRRLMAELPSAREPRRVARDVAILFNAFAETAR